MSDEKETKITGEQKSTWQKIKSISFKEMVKEVTKVFVGGGLIWLTKMIKKLIA